jgi:hypothetical protein
MSYGAGAQEKLHRNMVLGMAGIGTDIVTGTASSGAVTTTGKIGQITTESLTTANNAAYTLTMTNADIDADDLIMVTVGFGTATTGAPVVGSVTAAASGCVIVIHNKDSTGSGAFNGTLKINYLVIKDLI